MGDGGRGKEGWVSLQSRLDRCGEGESGRKNSYGDSLALAERAADAKFEKTSLSTGGLQCPLRKVFSRIPRAGSGRD